ncbi:MAG TPA: DUF177 domain-containing protein [Acidimicrobiales bacterium]|nr:DUF177 domain-containing protein [Acidimicrobiales bacterium]
MSRPPFLVPIAELAQRPGARQRLRLAGPLPGLELSSARLTDRDVVADVVLESLGETMTVTGTATGWWEGECRRCLETTGGELTVQLSEVFEPRPTEGETYPLGRDALDLEPVLREALALALPLAPLCDEACAGPDPDAHPVGIADDEVDEAEPPTDPRWGALDVLRFD